MKVDSKLTFLAASSTVVLVLGTVGFHQHAPENGWLTAAYQAVQLFSMESGVLDGEQTPVLIEVARWLALGTLVALVYAAAHALAGHLWSRLRIAYAKGHAIVCGAGQRGDVLARALWKEGAGKVVVIEMDENNASLGELRNLGVHVVIGNALDAAVLQAAGISRARSLVAVTGDDEKNLSICTEASSLTGDCEFSAGVESWAWRTFFLDRMKAKSRIRLDSYVSRATLGLMLEVACKAAREPGLRANGVRILIEASEARRHELVRAAILTLQMSGDRKPTLELTSASPGEEAAFADRFPAAGLVADLRWHRVTASQAFPEGAGESPDFAVFALDSDIETLEAAERFWMRHETPDDQVVACLDDDADSSFMDAINKRARDFRVVNLLKFGLGSQHHPLEPKLEEKAKRCHAVYIQNEKANNPDYGSRPGDLPERWADLPERYKESNRLSAMQNEVAKNAWSTRGDTPPLEMLTYLARCEHMRWMAERAMGGWRWSGSADKATRDNDKLKHHSLIAYDALSNAEKDKDFNAFLWALDISDAELAELPLDEKTKKMARHGRQVAA